MTLSISTIESADDIRIDVYRQIRERDLVGRKGLFVAEGEVVLRVLMRSRLMETLSVLVLENRVEQLRPDLSLLPANVPIYVATQAVMDQIVGFHIHRGILAIGKSLFAASADELVRSLPSKAVILGLVGICNHDNMGGIFRNAAAFGAHAVILDSTSCDPIYRKSIRVSVGGVFQVPYARLGAGESMLDMFARHTFTSFALSPAGTRELSDVSVKDRSAIIFGSEGEGLPHEMIERCQSVRIQMAQGFDSLNVATTSGIVLHHFLRSAGQRNF